MLYTYRDCIVQFGTQYQINKAIRNGVLTKISAGVYSDSKDVPEIEVIAFKYPRSVFTLNSAFYYHRLTDVIPNRYFLATSKDAYKISDTRVKQIFSRDDKFTIGISEMEYQGTHIRIYDRERMLIELMRFGPKMPFDYYKEIIESYRRIAQHLDIQKLQEYIDAFPKGNAIMEAIQLEVF